MSATVPVSIELDRKQRGRDAYHSLTGAELDAFLFSATHDAIEQAGGYESWERLPHDKQVQLGHEAHDAAIRQLGEHRFDALSPEEKAWASLFIWAGCGMHKELNAMKYGAKAMKEWWDSSEAKAMGAVLPILLYNKDNAAAASDPTASTAKARAEAVTSRGGIKATELAGGIMRHKNSKKGQQDTYRWYFEFVLGYMIQFPDTSNTRFGSYGDGASELVVHLPIYIDFLVTVRDAKGTGEFNNMEQNLYKALQDPPTLTELAVLSLYSQAVVHPFMAYIRSSISQNVLDLGPYYLKVIAHCQALIDDPDLLLITVGDSYRRATLGGQLWQRPEAILTVQKLYQDQQLPFLRHVLVVFLHGAQDGWKHFMSEFSPGGKIDSASPAHRRAAAMRTTNDHSESAFAKLRQSYHFRPSLSLLTRNARIVHKHNDTERWYQEHHTDELNRFARKEARERDKGNEEKADRISRAEELKRKARDEEAERERKKVKHDEYTAKIKSIDVHLSHAYWENPENLKNITLEKIRQQIAWLRLKKIHIPAGLSSAKKADSLQGLLYRAGISAT